MRFALLSMVAWLDVELLARFANEAEAELARVAAAWAPVDPSVQPPTVRVASVSNLGDDDTPVVFVDRFAPEDEQDLAYHSAAQDSRGALRPFGMVLAQRDMPPSVVTRDAFHELAETLVDPWVDLFDGGRMREVCDPVQEDPLTRGGVALSAWVPPAWFGLAPPPSGSRGGLVLVPSDEGFLLAPGAYRPGGYVMLEGGGQEPAGYRPAPHRGHRHSRAARRERALVRRALGA